jgi:acetyltransferase
MTTRNLDHLLRPTSVAVIGASNEPGSIGGAVMRNLLEAGFSGPILPVTSEHESVAGVLAYRDLARLRVVPDMAVICSDPQTVPGLIEDLAHRGTKAAIVLPSGLQGRPHPRGGNLYDAMLNAARPRLLRILGPNCMGLINPALKLNASLAPRNALPGEIAFVSQSGALAASVLDWAGSKGIGFSYFISLGDSADVDSGDILDYLASDPGTKAILLYIESLKAARKFMSAARAAARNKPVIVVKAGRSAEGAKAAASHTGALAGADDVFDAAIRRAGMLRVASTEDLFSAVETLARAQPLTGERLAIMTNGGGPGVLAADALVLGGGQLAELDQGTVESLDFALHGRWSHDNPVDIMGDAAPEEHASALQLLMTDAGTDAVLMIHAPTAIVPAQRVAEACVEPVQRAQRNVFSCFLGGEASDSARRVFANAHLPTYRTPEQAVHAFLQLVNYRRNQKLLLQIPPSVTEEVVPDTGSVAEIIGHALDSGRGMLSEPEAKRILAAYAIPVVETYVVQSAAEAVEIAAQIGYPVVLKIVSPDLTHKSEVGGVMLNLEDEQDVRLAARDIAMRLKNLRPGARLAGYVVQKMIRPPGTPSNRPGAHELIVGAATDDTFGPVVLFGHGGSAVEAISDRAVALPPLNMVLASDLISRTKVSRLLAGYDDRAPADLHAIQMTLIKVGQLIADQPEIVELDINPLIADEKGVMALDARMRIQKTQTRGASRLAIRPYPGELEHCAEVSGRRILVRPIRPEDAAQLATFFDGIEPDDLRLRYFRQQRSRPVSDVLRYTQIDYDREMALVAIAQNEGSEGEIVGDVRAGVDPENVRAELAIVVRSDWKGRGLGRVLTDRMIRYWRARGTRELFGLVDATNEPMLRLARRLGFEVDVAPNVQTVVVSLDLQPEKPPLARVELF